MLPRDDYFNAKSIFSVFFFFYVNNNTKRKEEAEREIRLRFIDCLGMFQALF